MAEGRMLKKVISESPRLAALKNDTNRLIYTWLIPHLDIEGRHSADPRVVKSHVAPILDHISHKIIRAALQDMAVHNLIVLYSANGQDFLELCRFKKHQNLRENRERPSDIPAPTPGGLREDSGRTPAQGNLSKEKLIKGKGQTTKEPVDNSPRTPPFEPKPEEQKPEPEEEECPPFEPIGEQPEEPKKGNGKDEAYLKELQTLVGQVKEKHPRLPIELWYGNNRRAHPQAILHVLRSLLKANEVASGIAYIQKALDVENGKYNAAEFDREQAGKRGPITTRGGATIAAALAAAGRANG
jgi:hypothetical protein